VANAPAIIRHTNADIWITSENFQNFDLGNIFLERRLSTVKAFSEVLWAERLILGYENLHNRAIGFSVLHTSANSAGRYWTMQSGIGLAFFLAAV
jgi:hypothetical protein